MCQFFVAGLINLETTLKVEGFPVDYFPVRYPFYGVNSTVSGVGYNIARALTTLGARVSLASLVGSDAAGRLALDALARDGLPAGLVLAGMPATAQSVILYDPQGRRQIHVDLKDIQERAYPLDLAREAIAACDLAVLCNINFSRPMLTLARAAGRKIVTDVHAIADLDDAYNRDYMAAADILFMSHEALPEPPEDWARRVMDRYGNEIVVIGLGAAGALLAVRRDGYIGRIPAVETRPVVSTIGAGDALFSSFVHAYCQDGDPYRAIRRAVLFASYKIGAAGAAEGFLSADELDQLAGA